MNNKYIIDNKIENILNVVPEEFFIERDIPEHSSYIRCGKYYEYYYTISKLIQPKSILEIGVRVGYSLLSMILASDKVNKVRGIDLEQYVSQSNTTTYKNIKKYLKDDIDFELITADTHTIDNLDFYDLIHLDGDHSYNGKLQDLELCKTSCKTLLIDDYDHIMDCRNAVDVFILNNKDIIEDSFYIPTFRGMMIIRFL